MLPAPFLDELFAGERNRNAQHDDRYFANERAPAMRWLREMDMHEVPPNVVVTTIVVGLLMSAMGRKMPLATTRNFIPTAANPCLKLADAANQVYGAEQTPILPNRARTL